MKYVRIYTGPDGLSHFEDVDIGYASAAGTAYSAAWDVKAMSFGRQPPGYVHDWHNAPRRQFAITLRGMTEMTASDGESRRFGPGDVMLAEDLTGRGHTARVVGDEERVFAFVPLAD